MWYQHVSHHWRVIIPYGSIDKCFNEITVAMETATKTYLESYVFQPNTYLETFKRDETILKAKFTQTTTKLTKQLWQVCRTFVSSIGFKNHADSTAQSYMYVMFLVAFNHSFSDRTVPSRQLCLSPARIKFCVHPPDYVYSWSQNPALM